MSEAPVIVKRFNDSKRRRFREKTNAQNAKNAEDNGKELGFSQCHPAYRYARAFAGVGMETPAKVERIRLGCARKPAAPRFDYSPVPFSVTVTGDVAVLLLITTVAVRAPVAVGWNCTLMLQFVPGAKVVVAAVVGAGLAA